MHVADSLSVEAPAWVPIHTTRLTLRPYEPTDASAFFHLIQENRARLEHAFPARVAAVRTLEDGLRVIKLFQQDWQARRLFVLGIWHTTTGEYLGDISLKPTWSQPATAELGYYLAATAQGHGYAREALTAAVQFGFGAAINAGRLDIRCYADNYRSHAVAKHVGFRPLPTRPRLWPLRQTEPEIRYFAFARSEAQDAATRPYSLSA
ncbi:GNAT family protein [Hymenobacter sp. GOD-10R]|uniref:GNAT family N-acetyltransferase n=1 Tax=Hymenobacter sp. GOD-10R TaxID=3093922 RepID=UPI002D7864BA|nr:GNAT family protein [Hymenobacter sp. GOD-10R]WRQ29502.1 GNAT family protein [Hymenobacter sp. GOD-10R]